MFNIVYIKGISMKEIIINMDVFITSNSGIIPRDVCT